MNLKETIKNISFSSIMSALITTILIIGGFIDMLDLLFACIASLILHIIYTKTNIKNALMIYVVSCVLSFILLPLRSCSLYFIFFFGYYPVLRAWLLKKINSKPLVYLLLIFIYNISMSMIFFLFSKIFGIDNEPVYIYLLLIITANIFYFSFELLIGRIMIIFEYRISKILAEKRKK